MERSAIFRIGLSYSAISRPRSQFQGAARLPIHLGLASALAGPRPIGAEVAISAAFTGLGANVARYQGNPVSARRLRYSEDG